MDKESKDALLEDIILDFQGLLTEDDRITGYPVYAHLLLKYGFVTKQDRAIGVIASVIRREPEIQYSPMYRLTESGKNIARKLIGSGAEYIIAIKTIRDMLDKENEEHKNDNEEGF